ncbi:MAG: glutathione S-transferase N-terminal domain-containing protein [Eggerthellaceae bacterium]|nr:glutathione S-transferase N-terminal domain-containing protein [Eggerthellaceae bacterium]
MKLPNTVLYYKASCMPCRKVLDFMDRNDIEIPLHDVLQGHNAQKLTEIGGMSQVPCLVIDGKAMYESEDIIAYLKEQLQKEGLPVK